VQPPTRVGFVGLGRMGQPMGARLRRAGVALTVFDTRENAVRKFVEHYGGAAATSLRALAERSETIITMLPDGDIVRRVVLGDTDTPGDRLLDGMARASVLIDMSSSSPTGTQALGRALAAHGIDMLDAPVSGGVARAERGTLSVMVGGEPTVLARCRTLLEPLAEHIFETGRLGSGHALKALNNLVSAAGLIAAAEALLIGRRFGLDPTVMIDVFNASTARNNSTENKFKQCILSRTFASGFSLDLMVKDLSTALDVADATNTPAPFSAACRELWAAAQAQLDAGADHTAVVRWFERLAGTTLTSEEG
jgi:3-hydroxyisobutyrate dehydrogenase